MPQHSPVDPVVGWDRPPLGSGSLVLESGPHVVAPVKIRPRGGGMRKLWIAVLAVAAVFATASVAVATNVYKVHLGSTTVRGKGTTAKPIPTGVKLGFKVEDSDPTQRGT